MIVTATRRDVLVALGLAASVTRVQAQATFPDKPIRVIVPFGPGGLADVTARIVGEGLAKRLGQQIVVVNQPGANGVTAARAVLSAEADGYTLALLTNGTAVTAALAKQAPFDAVSEFMPVSGLGTFDFLVLTSPATGFKDLGDALAAAKAAPGKFNIGAISVGSTQNLTSVLLKNTAAVDAPVVAFRTSPDVVTALLRNDVQIAVDGYVAAKSLLASGQLVALATTGAKRAPYLPDVPTAAESGVAVEAISWNGLFAKAGTPAAFVARLNTEINAVLGEAEVRDRLLDLGIEPRGGEPAEIGARLRDDIAKWSGIVTKAGIERQ